MYGCNCKNNYCYENESGVALLVLSRKLNESLIIGEDIVISVLAIDRDKIKLGIEAPREIPIVREELIIGPRQGEELTPIRVQLPEEANL